MKKYVEIFHEPTDEARPFWDACNNEKFLLQRCGHCVQTVYPPKLYCPHCGDEHLVWREANMKGTVYSFTHVFVSFNADFWNSQLPYTSLLIDLDDGVRFVSRLIGEDHQEVRVGDRVQIKFVSVENRKLPFVEKI